MTRNAPTYIHGFSLACALGHDEASITQALFSNNIPATRTLTFVLDDDSHHADYFSTFAAPLLSEPAIFEIIETHVKAAIKDAGWNLSDFPDIPILIGSTSYSMPAKEKNLHGIPPSDFSEACYQQTYCLNSIADFFAEKYGNFNVFSFATSCTSSSNAFIYAQRFFDSGYFERAVIVGFESHNALTIKGFQALNLLTEAGTVPFSRESQGLVLGEGIAAIAVSKHAIPATENPQKKDCFTLLGGASLCDTHNITMTHPDGNKVSEIMQKALDNAQIKVDQIRAIKAHATGSPMSDKAEIAGILNAFPSTVPIVALKPYVGHTLGACGALECVLFMIALKNRQLPPLPVKATSAEIISHIDALPLNLITEGMPLKTGYYLLSYLGFGGSNTALVLGFNQELGQ